MNIIIVEDEAVIRNGLVNLLNKINKGSKIVGIAENGLEGLKIINELKPDLVITDIKMPKMDGLEMLTKVAELGIKHKTIVLSAYSEFKYAQKAIKLGVNEYILKPISVPEIAQSLKNVNNQLIYEQKQESKNPKVLLSLEHIFQSSLFGELNIDRQLEVLLKDNYEIKIDDSFEAFVIYMGDQYDIYYKTIKNKLGIILSYNTNIKFRILGIPKSKELVIIFFNIEMKSRLIEYLQHNIIPQIECIYPDKMIFGYIKCDGILSLKDILYKLSQELHWNLMMGSNIIVDYPNVSKTYTLPISYPIDIEKELKTVICTMQFEKTDTVSNKFIKYCKGNLGNPKELKENFVRFAWTIVNITKEIDESIYKNFDLQHLLTSIMSAVTWDELEKALKSLILVIENNRELFDDKVTSLLVKRAKSIIHEFYNKGVTLEEIASKLDVTSEYLSTQFKKEVGESFSNYIKKYKINKAKKLLISTNLKLYQIADMVGYNDSKYFSKVFKEITSQLPVEYRKLYK